MNESGLYSMSGCPRCLPNKYDLVHVGDLVVAGEGLPVGDTGVSQ